MSSSNLVVIIAEFIVGALITQLLLIIVLAIMGGFDTVTTNLQGTWKANYEGIKSSIVLFFIVLDIAGGVGFVVAINGLLNKG